MKYTESIEFIESKGLIEQLLLRALDPWHKVRRELNTVRCINLHTPSSVWSKTTLNIGCVGRAWADPQT